EREREVEERVARRIDEALGDPAGALVIDPDGDPDEERPHSERDDDRLDARDDDKNALIAPTARPTPRAARIAQPIAQWWTTFSHPSRTSESPSVPATDTSNSPTAKGTSNPSVRTTSTACEPAIVWKLPSVKNEFGRSTPNTAITSSQTTMIPYRRERSTASRRASEAPSVRGHPADPADCPTPDWLRRSVDSGI